VYANNENKQHFSEQTQQVAESLPIGARATAAARSEPGWLNRGLVAANVPDDVKKSDHFLEDLTQRVCTDMFSQHLLSIRTVIATASNLCLNIA
jgi:hypothetical protein